MLRNSYYQGPVTDHFDGARFFHPHLPSSDKTMLDILRWQMQGQRAAWPRSVPARSGVRPVPRVSGLQITHVGHASYLVQTSGYNILVDPVWSERASPLSWLGPRRHNPPAVAFDDLPPIDAVLITHNHYDHLDTATLARLWERDHAPVYTPLGNDTIIRTRGKSIAVHTGDWWHRFLLREDLLLTIVPAYHWSSRSLGDARMALWGGFMLEAPAGLLYCAGDTAYRDGAIFAEIGRRFSPPRVAMLPIGAYAPRWFMEMQHANPQEAVQIAQACGAEHVLGVHWGTFQLTDEPFDEPAERLKIAAAGEESRFRAFLAGDTWSLPE